MSRDLPPDGSPFFPESEAVYARCRRVASGDDPRLTPEATIVLFLITGAMLGTLFTGDIRVAMIMVLSAAIFNSIGYRSKDGPS